MFHPSPPLTSPVLIPKMTVFAMKYFEYRPTADFSFPTLTVRLDGGTWSHL